MYRQCSNTIVFYTTSYFLDHHLSNDHSPAIQHPLTSAAGTVPDALVTIHTDPQFDTNTRAVEY